MKRKVWRSELHVHARHTFYRGVWGHSTLRKCLSLGALKCTENGKLSTALYKKQKT